MNRTNPPDAILREAWQRSGDWPFRSIGDVLGHEELAALANTGNRAAGLGEGSHL